MAPASVLLPEAAPPGSSGIFICGLPRMYLLVANLEYIVRVDGMVFGGKSC